MLRDDFAEIFELLTAKAVSYSINTNGTRITPAIARLLRKKGSKMVAIYGATPEMHDHITRNTGSFEATMQGIANLKEAGTSFIVQIVPMRDNYHQLNDMLKLARHLSPLYRFGAAWLYLSACGSSQRNAEISRQRLTPEEVIKIDQLDMSYEHEGIDEQKAACQGTAEDDRLLARCVARRHSFHIDPYGSLSICSLIKDPSWRYNLRRGSFQEAWDSFMPALADRVRGGPEYLINCGSCELRSDCRWCDVYGYLEHRRHGAKVRYLCEVARAQQTSKDNWQRHHRRYYQIAGITLQVEADLPITDQTFADKFKLFQVENPGPDLVKIKHHFTLPDFHSQDLGNEIYRQGSWVVYHKGGSWIYLPSDPPEDPNLYIVAVFNQDHTRGTVYGNGEEFFRQGNLQSLVLFSSDQIYLARVLADREACYLHSSGAILKGRGLLFVGHSDAGKSTIIKMLPEKFEALCDDRNIVRRWPEGFRVHGTWNHGEVPLVSNASAPLEAILFLQKARDNRLVRLKNVGEIAGKLLACLIKPLATSDWWEKMLDLISVMVREIPCYEMQFDTSGEVIPLLEDQVRQFHL